MTKQEFQIFLQKNIPVYLDGAVGTNLQKKGMPPGACPEEWILQHQETFLQLQREYVKAGANILYAPTFTANRIKLKEYGLQERIVEINKELVALSKKAAGADAWVAGDLTMTGGQLAPIGRMDFEELVNIYKEQISILAEADVDLLIIETMMSLQEARAALIAAKETCGLPVMVTMTFENDGRTLYGTDARTAAIVLESLGANAIGANCSTGPGQMQGIISAMAEVAKIPIIAKPNAGMPVLDENGATVYGMQPEQFADGVDKLIGCGASLVGGCCGTTPEHIAAMVQKTKDRNVPAFRKGTGLRYLTSERNATAFGLFDKCLIVGERINPTGKKQLQAQLKEGKLDLAIQFAKEQELCGADILDVNVGMGGIDEETMLLRVVEAVAEASSLPLSIDSSNAQAIETVLRRYPGRALINSISFEKERLKLLPIAKKYGAMFILLPLSDAGLPENFEEKKRLIDEIIKRAYEIGMAKEDIVVDGLVTTVAANKRAAIDALETIRYCKKQDLATICGLSNISFGLPDRSSVNTAFLTMAIQAGLTMAIANPSQGQLAACAAVSDLLMAKENADLRYIEKCSGQDKKETGSVQMIEKQGQTAAQLLRKAVIHGSRSDAARITQQALAEGNAPKELLNGVLIPAIGEVGDLFAQGKYFLPQLIYSAETMRLSIECLQPLLAKDRKEDGMAAVVIATVAGDIHDIGKNLVALMLRNYGYRVIDLGKDVPKEAIVEAAKKADAQIIALSALMTTTMQQMRQVIKYAREQGIRAKIIIGGAVTTQDYADEIGADGYSKDAADAVKLVARLTGGEIYDRQAEEEETR